MSEIKAMIDGINEYLNKDYSDESRADAPASII